MIEYYTEHGNAAIWQAVLGGFGLVGFVCFVGSFLGGHQRDLQCLSARRQWSLYSS